MALLYYTTDYNPARAQAEIQKLLLTIGARRISYEYHPVSREVIGLSFTLESVHGEQEYVLPARVDNVQRVLEYQGVLVRSRPRDHATRVAWRTLLEWLKVQAAMVETEQAAAPEVMLPYMLVGDNGHRVSVYQQFAQAALPAGSSV